MSIYIVVVGNERAGHQGNGICGRGTVRGNATMRPYATNLASCRNFVSLHFLIGFGDTTELSVVTLAGWKIMLSTTVHKKLRLVYLYHDS